MKLRVICLTVLLLFAFACSRAPYTLFQERVKKEADFFTLKDECPSCKKNDNISIVSAKPATSMKRVIYVYKIAPRDRLRIIVYNHPELSSVDKSGVGEVNPKMEPESLGIVVSAKGTINLPLIGDVKVSGLTEEKAAKLITQKYRQYLRRPFVTVQVLNKRIYVLGEVKTPGVIPLFSDSISLIEAIAETGGLDEYAVRDDILIIRGDLRNPEISHVDLTDLNAIKASDLVLKPNDIVYVMPNKAYARSVGIKAIMPPIDLISKILSSFANIKYLAK